MCNIWIVSHVDIFIMETNTNIKTLKYLNFIEIKFSLKCLCKKTQY